MKMLRLEYDIQHHLVLSRRVPREHAVIRMIVSTLSTPEELVNLRRRDFRRVKGREFEFFTVNLRAAGKSRVSPVDAKTYDLVTSLGDRPFDMREEEIDEIVRKYSPADRKYDAKKLRNAVRSLLKDASLFEIDFERMRDVEELYAFMLDFNPIYADVWELSDEEGYEEFVLNFAEIHGRDAEMIASQLGESEEKIRKILSSGKRSLLRLGEL